MFLLVTLISFGFSSSAWAADELFPELRIGDEVYTNVTVTSVTATDIFFTHSRGVGNAKLRSLSADLQKHFHYDAKKAAEKAREQAEQNAQYRSALLAQETNRQRVEQAESSLAEDQGDDIPPHKVPAKSFLDQPAPVIMADKWLTAQPDTEGKFVLIDFWATWCAPCKKSIPHLNSLAERFKDRLVIIGISDETEAAVRKMTEPRMDYSVAIDTQHRSSQAVGVTAIPHSLLMDPSGIVRFEGHPQLLEIPRVEKLMRQFENADR